MPSIPLPFVISLLLCLILVRMIRQGERKLGLFPLLVATFAAQAVLSGLNWNVGWHPARFIQPVVAAVLPALSFAAFNQLRRNRLARPTDMLPHLVPASYCDTDAFNASLCGWVRQSGVDLHAMDMQPAGRNNEGKRIEFAMAIDPAPVDVFQTNTLSKVSIPVEIVNLGQPGTIPRTALASETAKAIPKGTYSTIEDASHYSMFGECKPDAAEMAESERIGDPICSDGGGQSRLEIHKKLAKLVTDAFNRELKTDR
ncbi:hypothetical protein [Sinorhizobium meliloti]|uniref:hypothetical protein n=1 Tax=Rhizobium meliloti TaxID=382 RepID=UPI003F5CCFA2